MELSERLFEFAMLVFLLWLLPTSLFDVFPLSAETVVVVFLLWLLPVSLFEVLPLSAETLVVVVVFLL